MDCHKGSQPKKFNTSAEYITTNLSRIYIFIENQLDSFDWFCGGTPTGHSSLRLWEVRLSENVSAKQTWEQMNKVSKANQTDTRLYQRLTDENINECSYFTCYFMW